MKYGDYLKAWDLLQAAEDKIRRKFMRRPDGYPDSALAWEEVRRPSEEERVGLELLHGDRYRLNAQLAAEPEYFGRLRMWRVGIYGKNRECATLGGVRPRLWREVDAFLKEKGFGSSGSGSSACQWDVDVGPLRTWDAEGMIRLLSESFASELESGEVEIRRYSLITNYHKLALDEVGAVSGVPDAE